MLSGCSVLSMLGPSDPDRIRGSTDSEGSVLAKYDAEGALRALAKDAGGYDVEGATSAPSLIHRVRSRSEHATDQAL